MRNSLGVTAQSFNLSMTGVNSMILSRGINLILGERFNDYHTERFSIL